MLIVLSRLSCCVGSPLLKMNGGNTTTRKGLHQNIKSCISSCIQCNSLYKDGKCYRGYGHLLDTAALTVFMRLEALCTNLLIFYCYSIIICMLERIRLHAFVLLFIILYLSSVNLKALYMPVNIVICMLERIRLCAFLLFNYLFFIAAL